MSHASLKKNTLLIAAFFCLAWSAQADESDLGPVVVEDREEADRGAEAAAEAVARELLDLQKQQGGSAAERFRPEVFRDAEGPSYDEGEWREEVVPGGWAHRFRRGEHRHGDRGQPQVQPHRQPPAVGWSASAGSRVPSPVELLRESAWQLEHIAQRLEMSELYQQADSVRRTAQQLRLDARKQSGAPTSRSPQPGAALTPSPTLKPTPSR